ncbi:neuronal acetylcholine receptor subunit alpha-9 [Biomphalaria glabrata]|uniref:Neuronal acetylcholine receptor subunit alpha-9-like n=1 Tax=Biomphalaria glabrata TaxID=6526 RepID=A0A9U8E9R8_BIOGL|nr:neuronal acetylcholine receptor subunit alpha-9-like [Biomphalaria glabrata]KAI8765312.1 neuronal acetylcholine receptor subunit alpha-9-like [Biomphalaria glabrata]
MDTRSSIVLDKPVVLDRAFRITVTVIILVLTMDFVLSDQEKSLLDDAEVELQSSVPYMSTEKRLISSLLKTYALQGTQGRPVRNTSDNMIVYFGLSLIQILDLDESNQVLKASMWYRYEWNDILLTWDPAMHDNIKSVMIPSDKIWLPDILLYNFADDRLKEQRDALCIVQHTGDVQWMPQAILRSSCSIDTKYFPFDLQTCWLKFGSWTYNGNKLNVEFVAQHAFDLSDYVLSNEWDIVDNTAVRNVKYYNCCPEPFPDLTFHLTLKRKTAFYTFILILPCTLLSLLTLVIFWVPPESPAKLQLGMSVFVAFFFLLLVLADFTPRAAASIPLIGAYFCLSLVMITLSTVLACVVANMYMRGVRVDRPPRWMRSCTVSGVAKLFGVDVPCSAGHLNRKEKNCEQWSTNNGSRNVHKLDDFKMAKVRLLDNGINPRMFAQPEVFETPERDLDLSPDKLASAALVEEVRKIHELLLGHQEKKHLVEVQTKYLKEWQLIACITDRIFFTGYLAVNIITIIVLFCGT